MLSQLLLSLLPPAIYRAPLWLFRRLRHGGLPTLPTEFRKVRRGHHGLYKLINDYSFDTVLDVGAGAGAHAAVLHANRKAVSAIDFGTSVYAEHRSSSVPWQRVDIDFFDFTP